MLPSQHRREKRARDEVKPIPGVACSTICLEREKKEQWGSAWDRFLYLGAVLQFSSCQPNVSGWSRQIPFREGSVGPFQLRIFRGSARLGMLSARQGGPQSPWGGAGGRNRWEKGKPHKHAEGARRVHCCQTIVYRLFIHLKPKLGDRSTIPCHDQSP